MSIRLSPKINFGIKCYLPFITFHRPIILPFHLISSLLSPIYYPLCITSYCYCYHYYSYWLGEYLVFYFSVFFFSYAICCYFTKMFNFKKTTSLIIDLSCLYNVNKKYFISIKFVWCDKNMIEKPKRNKWTYNLEIDADKNFKFPNWRSSSLKS